MNCAGPTVCIRNGIKLPLQLSLQCMSVSATCHWSSSHTTTRWSDERDVPWIRQAKNLTKLEVLHRILYKADDQHYKLSNFYREHGTHMFHLEHIFQSGKSQGILPKVLEKWRNFSQFLFLIFSVFFLIEVYLLNIFLYLLNLLNKILENGKQNTGKVRVFVSPKMW